MLASANFFVYNKHVISNTEEHNNEYTDQTAC